MIFFINDTPQAHPPPKVNGVCCVFWRADEYKFRKLSSGPQAHYHIVLSAIVEIGNISGQINGKEESSQLKKQLHVLVGQYEYQTEELKRQYSQHLMPLTTEIVPH